MLVKVEELTDDLSRVRLFHTSVSRAIATWPTWPGEPGFTGDFAEYLAQKFPTSTAADFAILEAGVTSARRRTSSRACTGQPATRRCSSTSSKKYKPDLLLVGMPTTDEFQHQFLGLVSKKLPNGAAEPGVRRRRPQRRPGRPRRRSARGSSAPRTRRPTRCSTLARKLMGKDPTTFVASDHGFAPQFLAIDASQPLVELGLLSKPQTSNCRPATGETIGKAKACWAGGAVQIYLNVAGRDPAGGGFTQVAAADVAATVAAIKAKYLGLVDPNDWTHDGHPEGWKVIDRAFTKAEARYIPNGPGTTSRHGPSDPDGRPRGVLVPAVPVRRRDAGHARRAVALLRPARLRPGRPEPATPTSTCGRRSSPAARGSARDSDGTDDRPRADARVPARHPRAAAQPGQGPARGRSRAATASSRSRSSG